MLPLDGDLIAYKCQPVGRILYFAFGGPHPFTMKGEPAWVDDDRYDFQAKVAPEVQADRKKFLQEIEMFRKGLKKGRFSDSTKLIRDDRDQGRQ